MKKTINKLLQKFGIAIYRKSMLNYQSLETFKLDEHLNDADVAYLNEKLGGGLKEKLIKENRLKWLDIGCGGNLDKDFYHLDTFPEGIVQDKERYFRVDIINANEEQLNKLGKFDLVRMQHVFEHFTPEEGIRVLKNCSVLLNQDGYIIITTPDLLRFVKMYLTGEVKNNKWALNRIAPDSPDSFYFSVYAHSMLYEQHKWCYDAEGLVYQLTSVQRFKNIRHLKLTDPLASTPFTHNKPGEDVCVIAQLQ